MYDLGTNLPILERLNFLSESLKSAELLALSTQKIEEFKQRRREEAAEAEARRLEEQNARRVEQEARRREEEAKRQEEAKIQQAIVEAERVAREAERKEEEEKRIEVEVQRRISEKISAWEAERKILESRRKEVEKPLIEQEHMDSNKVESVVQVALPSLLSICNVIH
jgi:hypothetical protein